MEQIIIKVENEIFSVEFTEIDGWYSGNVYPITEWEKFDTGEKGWAYNSKTVGGNTYDTLNDDVRIMFGFLFVWRGVWEGRIYFKDDEYWSDELKNMSDLWDKLEPILKNKIRQKEPDKEFDD